MSEPIRILVAEDHLVARVGVTTIVNMQADMKVVAEAAGNQQSLYVTADGNLWAMGDNRYGELGDGTYNSQAQPEMIWTNVVAVAAGNGHSLFVTADGTLRVMGNNSAGELGDRVW